MISAPDRLDRVEQCLTAAREIGEPGLLLRALIACGSTAAFNADVARPYLAEALELARARGDTWRLSQVLCWQARAAITAGEPRAALEAGVEGSSSPMRSETTSSPGYADSGESARPCGCRQSSPQPRRSFVNWSPRPRRP